jgi:hypothetical protein
LIDMAASAPMAQYARAMAENKMRDRFAGQMGMSPGAPDMDAMMAEAMAGKTVAGKGQPAKKRKGKK